MKNDENGFVRHTRMKSGLKLLPTALIFVVLLSCATREADTSEWNSTTMNDLSYSVPPDWKPLKKSWTHHVYSFSGTSFNAIQVEMYPAGKEYKHINTDASGIETPWELAETELMNFKSDPSAVEIQLTQQKPFPDPEKTGFLMKLRVKRTNGLKYLVRIVGVKHESTIYRITISCEEHQIQRWSETFKTFIRRVKFGAS